jgi:hypothetical protein
MISSYEYSCLASALSEEREEVRLPVGRMETTVDWQNHSIDEDGVLTGEKCNHTRDMVVGQYDFHRLELFGIEPVPRCLRHPSLIL